MNLENLRNFVMKLSRMSQLMSIGSFLLVAGIVACQTKAGAVQPTSNLELPSQIKVRPNRTPPGRDISIDEYQLEDVEAVMNYGVVVLQQALDAKLAKRKTQKIFSCDPSISEVNRWMMKLKSLSDLKTERDRMYYLRHQVSERVSDPRWQDCEKTCMCGAYASLIEGIDSAKLEKADLELSQSLRHKFSTASPSALNQCAKAVGWFCESALRKFLKTN